MVITRLTELRYPTRLRRPSVAHATNSRRKPAARDGDGDGVERESLDRGAGRHQDRCQMLRREIGVHALALPAPLRVLHNWQSVQSSNLSESRKLAFDTSKLR